MGIQQHRGRGGLVQGSMFVDTGAIGSPARGLILDFN